MCGLTPNRFCLKCVTVGDLFMELSHGDIEISVYDPEFLRHMMAESGQMPMGGISLEPWFKELCREYVVRKL